MKKTHIHTPSFLATLCAVVMLGLFAFQATFVFRPNEIPSFSITQMIAYGYGTDTCSAVTLSDSFEDGTISPFTSAWTVVSDTALYGSRSARSFLISNDEATSITISQSTQDAGIVSFGRRVSSESGHDYLSFYIDGVLQQQWSGEVAWSEVSFTIPSLGMHTYTWTYSKDASGSSGSDRAWIDMVRVGETCASSSSSSSSSSTGPVCGNGTQTGSEGCDDGNTTAGDGCSATCTVESGYSCTGTAPSTCSQVCGNGIKTVSEGCDDSNTTAGDGCSATCTVESGYSCSGTAPSVCTQVCGNGVKTVSEGCDDSNTTAGDGCSATCTVESGYSCSGTAPSSCTQVCGNGIKTVSEGCDDGNTSSGDGCSNLCAVESGYSCTGTAPSSCTTTCGDGVTAGSEQCDGSGETSLCNSDCTTRSCGDSKINATAGETCDNGANNAADKACNTSCHITTCGDGVVQDPNGNGQTESCEPALDGTCTAQCMYAAGVGISTTTYSTQQTSSTGVRLAPPPNCGNGVLETAKGEFCDDGRFNGLSPHCDRWCHTQFCGDGVVETQNDEECEPPRSADGTLTAASCGNICTVPACDADGVCVGGCKVRFVQCLNSSASSVGSISTVQLSTAGATSSSSSSSSFRDVQQLINQGIQQATSLGGGAGESSSSVQSFILPISLPPGSFTPGNDPFTPSLCGNSQVDPGEECDDGELNSDSRPDACRTNCKKAFCDDGVQDSSEQCDRGAADNQIGNGCTPTCKVSICGNSTLEPGEECDDGPRNSPSMPDSCSALCLLPRCGDGVVDANFGEACDNGINNSDTKPNGCRLNCAPAHCGDSVKDDNEECDDGPNGSATCSSACILVASDIHPAAPAAAGIPEDSVVPLVFFVLIMIGMTGWRISKMFR